jgi:hypothetical protein
MKVIKRMLIEPLLHFLLLGAGLFVVYSLMQKPGDGGEPGEIVITQGQIENLAAAFSKTWQRPPTPAELTGLVRDRVREEVYYREAMALGLDRDDAVIRRRLRQKMEFVSEDIAAQAEATEAELSAYLRAHPDKFRTEARFSFSQVYLNPAKRGDRLASDAAALLAQLQQDDTRFDIGELGDALILPKQLSNARSGEVANLFGDAFAAKLAELAPGRWQGPVESGFGWHLLRVSERSDGGLPALAEVRGLVQREWANARRLEANDRFYQGLLQRYTVTIEGMDLPAEQDSFVLNAAQ